MNIPRSPGQPHNRGPRRLEESQITLPADDCLPERDPDTPHRAILLVEGNNVLAVDVHQELRHVLPQVANPKYGFSESDEWFEFITDDPAPLLREILAITPIRIWTRPDDTAQFQRWNPPGQRHLFGGVNLTWTFGSTAHAFADGRDITDVLTHLALPHGADLVVGTDPVMAGSVGISLTGEGQNQHRLYALVADTLQTTCDALGIDFTVW